MPAGRERFVGAAGVRAEGAVGPGGAGGGRRLRGAAQQQTPVPGQEPGPAAPPEPRRDGGREGGRDGREGGMRRWEPSPWAGCGAGGEAAPGEGRRRGGKEGMLLNSFLP